ncbi:copper amine oxidase N-terminal domain-containing protein [Paenibacillus sp. DMB20]|uniref:copper amine oxidase N-terminal domain-containing protein n=1 Tax=Paenibacillus sp. DMB20 TaxID=1642570 RepID=UPI000627E111|nr:copper amine oxidase N-terminal domain-containing protein [Paenibacillus sp. DMB20]KKO54133.1 hypothetical protein XI25_08680 [Paenibacillus sp. DMB20]
MKKFWAAFLAGILMFPMLFQSQAQAAVKINILINGVQLKTSQSPVMIQGRVMLPMRSMFEALGAKINWSQRTQTVTAVKGSTKIVLKINAKTATINGKTVKMDVPAKNLKGATMVPVRFVSEALGEKVGWSSRTKTVTVTTGSVSYPKPGNGGGTTPPSNPILGMVNYVSLKDIGNYGDGRDLQVNFTKSYNEQRASHYRVMIVKSSKSSGFGLSSAYSVPSANYTSVYPNGSDPSVTLTSASRDVDGDLIRDNQAYVGYVLAVGNNSNETVLSRPSSALTLTNSQAVEAATNVRGNDVSDYGDGRDLSVSFTRASNESNIAHYRIFAVKTNDINKFDLSAAKSAPSQNYATVYKTSSSSSTLSAVLGSSARDSSGELIRNGISYTLYVLSVSSNENTTASRLSSSSSSITLSTGSSTSTPVITDVTDVSDYGDGRDLRVSFTRVSDESRISNYRIFVVKSSDSSYFDLNRANNVSSNNSTYVSKTGYNTITQTLSSTTRDVDGNYIRSGVYYRVFVMAVSNGSYSSYNTLSSASREIILSGNTNGGGTVGSVSGLYISDVNDYNDGRDLEVSFNRLSDESNLSHYQVFVVKSHKTLDQYKAESLSSYYYTQIYKTGYNIRQTLNSGSRDTDGDYIRNGNSYRVYVLSAPYSGYKALSSSSSTITLTGNQQVDRPTNVEAKDVADKNNASDLQVTFRGPSNESNINQYKILVVKSQNAPYFDLSKANAVSSSNSTAINRSNGSYTVNLPSGATDVDGAPIRSGVPYKVFVLSVATKGTNALSSASNEVTLTGSTPVDKVTEVKGSDEGTNNDGRDLIVSFKKAADESRISHYQVYVVKVNKAQNFTEAVANSNTNFTRFDKKGGDFSQSLGNTSTDTDGEKIRNLVDYNIFVLSVSKDGNANNNALSAPSAPVTLSGENVAPPQNVSATVYYSDSTAPNEIRVTFAPPANAKNIKEYRVMVIPFTKSFGLDEAKKVTAGNYTVVESSKVSEMPIKLFEGQTLDVTGAKIAKNTSYKVAVLAVGDGTTTASSELSDSTAGELIIRDPKEATNVTALVNQDGLQVSFKKAAVEQGIGEYQIMLVPDETVKSFSLKTAATVKTENIQTAAPTGKDQKVTVPMPTVDSFGKEIQPGKSYQVFVVSVVKTDKTTATTVMSQPSKSFVLKSADAAAKVGN